MNNEEQEREKQGIEAIIYLQNMAGIKETEETAMNGWRKMTKREQDFTLNFYPAMKQYNEKNLMK